MFELCSAPLPLFGQRLRRLRRAMGVKQQALAQSLSLDQATVSRWESGQNTPSAELQQLAFDQLAMHRTEDSALRRLVEQSTACVHLIDDATHRCLAYSKTRAREWNASQQEMRGALLWQFATEEIQQAEAELAEAGWWSQQFPEAKQVYTSGAKHGKINVREGNMLWERMYLADGTPVRLTTGI